MKKILSATQLFTAFLLLTLSIVPIYQATAQTMPSQQQLEQLKNLPRAQQEQIARQFGVDVSMLDQLNGDGETSLGESSNEQENIIFPRGTRFDENGDPIIPEDVEKQFTRDDKELKPFGYELFAGEPKNFAPVSHAPVPSNYIMGVGDSIQVQLFGKESLTHDLTIDREGKVVIPKLGAISVAGLTYTLMQELIQSRVDERLIGYDAAVSMGELRSIQVFIVGEAYKPGAYTVSSLSTISQALYVAGGVSNIASLRSVRLMRGGDVAAEFDLYDLLLNGDASDDKMLQSGDVVFIPARGDMITVKGQVKRPALYELKGDETLKDALRFAGGAEDDAYLASAQLQRIANGKRLISTVDLTANSDLNRAVAGGDVLTLRQVSSSLDSSLMLIGAVSRPGHYEWRDGIKINDILIDSRHDLLEQADLGYGLVVREQGSRRQIQVHQFEVGAAIRGDAEENLTLQERDQILIFSRYQTKDEEEQKLSRFTLTEQEKEEKDRKQLLKEYRMAFLKDLVKEKTSEEELDEELKDANRFVPLREMFGSSEEDEMSVEKEDLALYSRENLLEPIMQRLQRQRTENGNTPFVYVAGEVNHPGVYPLVENASAEKLLDAAGGLKDSAYLERAEITRVNIGRSTAETDYLTVELGRILNGEVDVQLQGRDRLNVLSIPEWQNTYEVTLRGEVNFPGTYAIKRGESLTDLIKRAGGFTDHAFIEGAVFTREELRERQKERMQLLAEELQREIASNMITGSGDSRVSYSQMRTLLADLMSTEPVGRLILDLPQVLATNGARDVQLKDGDTLHVPSQADSISIMGEVQMATSYRFDPELGVSDYISRSGGIKEKADEDRIYVVKANGAIVPFKDGSSWFSFGSGTQLSPGDTIVVPLDTTYSESLELWSQVTGIIYNSAVAIAAINGI
jgi:protein involved in polysaccharide export with SLBB domain